MELTEKQLEALKICIARYRAGEPYTIIAGYAGVGKSTLVKFIIAELGLDPNDVAYVAFTGKAAEVLRNKGNPNATTAHKLLYWARKNKNGKFTFSPKKSIGGYKLIVVDEVSMLPKNMWEQLLRHRIHVLACGDPFQLKPVDSSQDGHLLDSPHVFLDQVMRQAAESDIITTSMKLRQMIPFSQYDGKDIKIIPANQVDGSVFFWADEVICATNKTRRELNEAMRKAQGRGDFPEIGDKMICLKNCWNIASEIEQNPIVNGTIGYITRIEEKRISYKIFSHTYTHADVYVIDLESNGDIYRDLIVDKQYLLKGQKTFSDKQEAAISKQKENEYDLPLLMDYGQCITCHRAQGSQWSKVVYIEEGFPYEKEEHFRHAYTGTTRSENQCVVIMKE